MLINNVQANSNSKSNSKTHTLDKISNQELIDIYKSMRLHYASNNLSSYYDAYFENYYNRVTLELDNRGIEIIINNNNFEVYFSKIDNLNNLSNIVNQNTIITKLPTNKSKISLDSIPDKFSKSNFSEDKISKYVYQVEGESMENLGIYSGDFVYCTPFRYKLKGSKLTFEEIGRIIDKKLVITKLFDTVFIKVAEYLPKVNEQHQSIILKSHNPNYYNFKIKEDTNFMIIGIVNKLERNF